jgi:hypothetical protein
VFFIKYLRTLGSSATNDIFAENAWYLRNARTVNDRGSSVRTPREIDLAAEQKSLNGL